MHKNLAKVWLKSSILLTAVLFLQSGLAATAKIDPCTAVLLAQNSEVAGQVAQLFAKTLPEGLQTAGFIYADRSEVLRLMSSGAFTRTSESILFKPVGALIPKDIRVHSLSDEDIQTFPALHRRYPNETSMTVEQAYEASKDGASVRELTYKALDMLGLMDTAHNRRNVGDTEYLTDPDFQEFLAYEADLQSELNVSVQDSRRVSHGVFGHSQHYGGFLIAVKASVYGTYDFKFDQNAPHYVVLYPPTTGLAVEHITSIIAMRPGDWKVLEEARKKAQIKSAP